MSCPQLKGSVPWFGVLGSNLLILIWYWVNHKSIWSEGETNARRVSLIQFTFHPNRRFGFRFVIRTSYRLTYNKKLTRRILYNLRKNYLSVAKPAVFRFACLWKQWKAGGLTPILNLLESLSLLRWRGVKGEKFPWLVLYVHTFSGHCCTSNSSYGVAQR